MALTAKTLSRRGVSGSLVQSKVAELLKDVDEKLQAAPRQWGVNLVDYELPREFALAGLDVCDQQLLVYSKVIENLKGRGFEVSLTTLENGAGEQARTIWMLHVAWEAVISREEVQAMKAVVFGCRLEDPVEVAAFRETGRLPPAQLVCQKPI